MKKGNTRDGRNKFYRQLNVDKQTRECIRFYNKARKEADKYKC